MKVVKIAELKNRLSYYLRRVQRGESNHSHVLAIKSNLGLEAIARAAEVRMEEIVRTCHVIIDVEPVKSLATRLLRLHALRAADALQLGAALHWTEGHPQGRTLHTLDSRLALAAQREGFVVPP